MCCCSEECVQIWSNLSTSNRWKWISYWRLVAYFKDWVCCVVAQVCVQHKHFCTSSPPLCFFSLVWSSKAHVLADCPQPHLHWEKGEKTQEASCLALCSGCVLMVCSFSSIVPKKSGEIKIKCKTWHKTPTHLYPHGLCAGLKSSGWTWCGSPRKKESGISDGCSSQSCCVFGSIMRAWCWVILNEVKGPLIWDWLSSNPSLCPSVPSEAALVELVNLSLDSAS